MTNEITTKDLAEGDFDIDLDGLSDGDAVQSASLSNSNDYPAALIGIKIKTGSVAHDDGSVFTVYLFRRLTAVQDDGLGASAAAATLLNCPVLGSLKVTDDPATSFEKTFSTEQLGPLGPEWGIAVKNNTGQDTDNSSPSNHEAVYRYYVPELQEP